MYRIIFDFDETLFPTLEKVLEIYDEISCGDLFGGDDTREGIVIFSLRKVAEAL